MYDETAIAALMQSIDIVIDDPVVISITDHFAGYWDELGITVTVDGAASDTAISGLREKLQEFMRRQSLPFRWIVMFARSGETVSVIVPDNE